MVRRKVYLSVLMVGLVFAFLVHITEQSSDMVVTIVFLTFAIILTMKLYDEHKYFRSYNAPIASSMFLIIPSLIAVIGSLISSYATIENSDLLQTSLMEIGLNITLLDIGFFNMYFNIFSLFICVPYFILLIILFRRYYSTRYPNLFIRRKRFPSNLVLFYSVIVNFLLVINWMDSHLIDLTAFAFVSLNILLIIQYYIAKIMFIPFRRERVHVPSQPRSSRPVSPTRTSSQSSNSSSSVQRTSSRPTTMTTPPSRSSSSNNVKVSPPVRISHRTINDLSPDVLRSLKPAGQHVTRDDFRCIFCYEFPIEPHVKVIICPNCKYPSHEGEFFRWQSVSSICSRCNKPIKNVKMIRLSGKNYKAVIDLFDKESK